VPAPTYEPAYHCPGLLQAMEAVFGKAATDRHALRCAERVSMLARARRRTFLATLGISSEEMP